MNARQLAVMVVVAGLLAGGAWYVSKSRRPASGVATIGTPLFPELDARLDHIARVDLWKGKDRLRIERQDAGWVLRSSAGYPVPTDKVRELAGPIARAKIIAEKTSRSEYFERIDVQDVPEAPASDKPEEFGRGPALVRFVDAAGAEIAGVIVGRRESGVTLGEKPGVFARRTGGATAYLVDDLPMVDAALRSWVDPKIIQLDAKRVSRVELEPVSGPPVRIVREAPAVGPVAEEGASEGKLVLLDVPAGREVKGEGILASVAGALGYVSFDDVRARAEVFGEGAQGVEPMGRARFEGGDRLVVSVTLARAAGRSWAAFDVVAGEGAAGEISKEAAELSSRLGGWAFALPNYTVTQLTQGLEALLKEPAPPTGNPSASPAVEPGPGVGTSLDGG